ncbi:MAG: hypothetical protein OXH75_08845 [Acidobacteria bacterium]|nr:hypothetical protein [Acidobacteriota bacterium]
MARTSWYLAGAVGFGLLALLNVGGYRYGVSDQAFYVPVVLQQIDPRLFPHDAGLLDAQNRFFAFDDWFAVLIVATGASVPAAFLLAYLGGLAMLYAAAAAMGRSLYFTGWGTAAFVAALAIRHRIPDTAVNTLESYLHPRQLAFAVGLAAVALFLHRGRWSVVVTVALAALFHPTTALWFAVLLGPALLVADRGARRPLLAMTAAGAAVAVLAAGRATTAIGEPLAVMDPQWSTLLEVKDYLLATDWPLSTWFVNLGLAGIVAAVYTHRRRQGWATTRETGLVAGAASLLLLFAVSVPLARAGVAAVVQLQVNRVFWVLDVLALWYVVWALVESQWARRPLPVPRGRGWPALEHRHAVVALVVVAAVARGSYVTLVERAGRPLVEVDLPPTEWTEVMHWAERQPVGTHFLADPGHAWRYGSSVRAAAGRDVYLEEVKDVGIAIYSSAVAERVRSRRVDLGDFATLDAERARRLARRYELHFLIAEQPIDLPAAYRHGPFTVYDLRPALRSARRRTEAPAGD